MTNVAYNADHGLQPTMDINYYGTISMLCAIYFAGILFFFYLKLIENDMVEFKIYMNRKFSMRHVTFKVK